MNKFWINGLPRYLKSTHVRTLNRVIMPYPSNFLKKDQEANHSPPIAFFKFILHLQFDPQPPDITAVNGLNSLEKSPNNRDHSPLITSRSCSQSVETSLNGTSKFKTINE